jgi:hypothetical protein
VSVYDLYKPLRNELRHYALVPSLRVIWAWMQHLQFNVPFPQDIQVPWEIALAPAGPKKGIYEWELALLAKELLINAPEAGSSDLRSWTSFSGVVNTLKKLDNDISIHYEHVFKENILVEMSRHAHHQFGWQDGLMYRSVTRYLKIFSYPALDAILQAELGISAHALYTIGLSMAGHFLTASDLDLPITFSVRGVTAKQIETFLERFSEDEAALRASCNEKQSYDQDFIYTLNPLQRYPLMRYVHEAKNKITAPIPTNLLRRFTEGVYYEVLNCTGFNVAFGEAFQGYVGEALIAASKGRLSVLPESEYDVGRDRKDSVDWIVSDETGEVFVECKTKRIRREAKFALLDLAPLRTEIDKLVEIVAQTYKTLADGLAGRYEHWKPSQRPIYPVIVTLEEWYYFGPTTAQMTDARLREVFAQRRLDAALLDTFPFTICSISDFERLMSLVAIKGVDAVMKEKVTPKRRMWLVHGALLDAFHEDFASTRTSLFPFALDQISMMSNQAEGR